MLTGVVAIPSVVDSVEGEGDLLLNSHRGESARSSTLIFMIRVLGFKGGLDNEDYRVRYGVLGL